MNGLDNKLVNKGIPQTDFLVNYNVTSEVFWNFHWKSKEDLVSDLFWYLQRSIWLWVIPQNTLHIVPYMPSNEYLSYLSDLKWKGLSQEDMILLSDAKSMADRALSLNSSDFYSLNFISTWIAQDLMWVLWNSSRNVVMDNLWLEKEVNEANSKSYLRTRFSDLMVNWQVVDLNYSWKDELKYYFTYYSNLWYSCILRLDRSVSWVWMKKIDSYEDLEKIFYLIESNRSTVWNKILIEIAIDPDRIKSSPSCLGYVSKDWDIDLFWFTDQKLDWSVHQWNTVIKEDDKNEKLSYMKDYSLHVWSKINNELYVNWFFWVDFMLIDIDWYSDKDLWFIFNTGVSYINVWDKTYAMVLCEVNRRITWAYASPMICNLFDSYISDALISNYNTFSYNFTDKFNNFQEVQNYIILKLRKNWLLFDPSWDSNKYGVFPFSIQEWKLQVVIVAKDEEHEKYIINKLRYLLEEK